MDDFPVGNPKYSRIKATYAQPPVRQAHPATTEPRDDWRQDFAVVATAILVLICIFLLASAGAVPAR